MFDETPISEYFSYSFCRWFLQRRDLEYESHGGVIVINKVFNKGVYTIMMNMR